MVDVIPVDVPEECMGHDFLGIGRTRAQSQLGLTSKQFLQDRDRVAGHVDGIQRLVGENGVIDFVLILTTEGGLLKKHLVDKDTECPPIDSTSVLLIQENLIQTVRHNPRRSTDKNILPRVP